MNVKHVSQSDFDEFYFYIKKWHDIAVSIRGNPYDAPYSLPVWENGRIVMRTWSDDTPEILQIIEPALEGFQLITKGGDRYHPNKESPHEFFSRFDWIGKYIFRAYGDSVRGRQKKDPANWFFLDKPLPPSFAMKKIREATSATWLIDDPGSYFTSNTSFGPEISQYITLTYAELDEILTTAPKKWYFPA